MLQLILHGIGDYFVQTDKWALNKKKKGNYGLWCCFIHCLTYSLPFIFIGGFAATGIIFITHFIIDRTNIVAYALAWKNGVRKYQIHDTQGYLIDLPKEEHIKDTLKFKMATVTYDISNFGFGLERPFAITIWLYIICDNLCHIICNYVALKYF